MRHVFQILLLCWAFAALSPVFGGNSDASSGFVLLKNLTVLPGKVTEEPGFILIREGESEVRLSRDRVACWAPSIAALHQYLIDTRPGSTLESHLSVARWCILNHYPAGAVAELIAARRIDPNNAMADQLEQELREWHAKRNAEPAKLSPDTGSVTSSETESGAEQELGSAVANPFGSENIALASAEMSSDSTETNNASVLDRQLASFTRDVQPILMNRCGQAACHGVPGQSNFVLQRPHRFDARPNAVMSRQNLQQVLNVIDFQHLEASPLMVKALQPHGELDTPPLRPQDRTAADQLRKWVMGLSDEREPFLHEPSHVVQAGGRLKTTMTPDSKLDTSNRVVRVPEIEDPFDPEVFNRRYHPDKRDR